VPDNKRKIGRNRENVVNYPTLEFSQNNRTEAKYKKTGKTNVIAFPMLIVFTSEIILKYSKKHQKDNHIVHNHPSGQNNT